LNAARPIALSIALCSVAAACISSQGRACRTATDVAELSRLSINADSTVNALRTAADTQAIWLRQYLQAIVDRTAELDGCGRLGGPNDLRAAAALALQASVLGVPTVERAYRWSRRAVDADTADRRSWRTMASAWDQLQVLRKQPQWFATVFSCAASPDGRCALAAIDTTRVTDPQRVELGLNTLVQQRALIDSLNRARGRP
jgi:hypothetical protein